MKKTMKFLAVFTTAILIAGIAGAQHSDSPRGHVNFGIKGGINLYDVHHDNSTKYNMATGYHFGFLGHIHFNRQFAFQPEIILSNQGARYTDENVNTRYILDYINIPVMFQYMFDNGFRLQAGPQVGFLINAKSKINNNVTNIKDAYNPIDFGLSIGASYVFPPTGFGIDARFNLGLTDINQDNSVYSTNRGLQLGIFYIFGHSKN
jgi:hypothetical protein